MNPSSQLFDTALKEIPHYQSFPAMLPFVGGDYVSSDHSKLLIIGESFYFPEESYLHKDPLGWYSSDEKALSEDEVAYINCRGLLECDWSSPGHKMYRELNACLLELQLPSTDRPVSHVGFTNAFLRPARDNGGSFKACCSTHDVDVSIDILTKVITVLAPDSVIFASKYAWDVVGWRIEQRFSDTTFSFVAHPTAHFFWNVDSYEHGRAKFIDLLKSWAAKQVA